MVGVFMNNKVTIVLINGRVLRLRGRGAYRLSEKRYVFVMIEKDKIAAVIVRKWWMPWPKIK